MYQCLNIPSADLGLVKVKVKVKVGFLYSTTISNQNSVLYNLGSGS